MAVPAAWRRGSRPQSGTEPYLRGMRRQGEASSYSGCSGRNGRSFTHHRSQTTINLCNGNNTIRFGGRRRNAAGHRAVMISTHCDLEEWEGLTPSLRDRKPDDGRLARRVYPRRGNPLVCGRTRGRTSASHIGRAAPSAA